MWRRPLSSIYKVPRAAMGAPTGATAPGGGRASTTLPCLLNFHVHQTHEDSMTAVANITIITPINCDLFFCLLVRRSFILYMSTRPKMISTSMIVVMSSMYMSYFSMYVGFFSIWVLYL